MEHQRGLAATLRQIQTANDKHFILEIILEYVQTIRYELYGREGINFILPKIQSAKEVLEERFNCYDDEGIIQHQMELWKYFQAFKNPFKELTDPLDSTQIIEDRKRVFLHSTAEFFRRCLFVEPSGALLGGVIQHWAIINSLGVCLFEGMTETDLLLVRYKVLAKNILFKKVKGK